jgi:hypothetical protein
MLATATTVQPTTELAPYVGVPVLVERTAQGQRWTYAGTFTSLTHDDGFAGGHFDAVTPVRGGTAFALVYGDATIRLDH